MNIRLNTHTHKTKTQYLGRLHVYGLKDSLFKNLKITFFKPRASLFKNNQKTKIQKTLTLLDYSSPNHFFVFSKEMLTNFLVWTRILVALGLIRCFQSALMSFLKAEFPVPVAQGQWTEGLGSKLLRWGWGRKIWGRQCSVGSKGKKEKKDSISSFKNRIPISTYFSHKCLRFQFVDI